MIGAESWVTSACSAPSDVSSEMTLSIVVFAARIRSWAFARVALSVQRAVKLLSVERPGGELLSLSPGGRDPAGGPGGAVSRRQQDVLEVRRLCLATPGTSHSVDHDLQTPRLEHYTGHGRVRRFVWRRFRTARPVEGWLADITCHPTEATSTAA